MTYQELLQLQFGIFAFSYDEDDSWGEDDAYEDEGDDEEDDEDSDW